MFLMFIQLLKPCIPSIAALLSEYILTFDSEGAASKAVHIAPSSARVEEGQSAILLLKLILFLLLSLLAIIYPIPIFFPLYFLHALLLMTYLYKYLILFSLLTFLQY